MSLITGAARAARFLVATPDCFGRLPTLGNGVYWEFIGIYYLVYEDFGVHLG